VTHIELFDLRVFQTPTTEHQWRTVADGFWTQWNFPHCLGALDGKHVRIQPPPDSGSLYYNYKHFNSVVLMALVDACYRFLYVDIGSYGRISDGGVFNSCSLAEALETNCLNIPGSSQLPESNTVSPFVIVADDAFALRKYVMKPYSQKNLSREQRIFNYRLSRARRVVENAFGIMASRFRILLKAINLSPEKVQTVVMAICCLHNFLLRNPTSAGQYISPDDEPVADLAPLEKQKVNRASNEAMRVRENLCLYFNSEAGSVSWQGNYI